MSREKAALVTAIDKCLDQKDATCGVVSKCYAAAARHGALGITELQEVLGLTSHGLGLPAWLFAGAEKVCESFDLNGNGMIEEDEARRIVWKLLQQKRLELAGRRQIKVAFSSVVAQGYTVVKELGRGGQGTMYLCTKRGWFQTSKYCIKFYEKADANAGGLDELMDEYALMSSLDNPHIAKTYEVFQDKSFYYLVNEPYFGGDLTKLGKNAYQKGIRMSESWWRGIFKQCMEGLCYLHSQGVMHCDIKEPNIMIATTDYEAPRVVLIDFGLSTAFTSLREGVCGTPGYIPPETWRTGIWFPRGDVFSMGIVFFQCICGLVPSKNGTVQGALVAGCGTQDDIAQASQTRPLPWERFPNNMPMLQELIELMTLRDRGFRPRALQALDHDWLSSSSDAELPGAALQGLVGCAASHEVVEELQIRLGEANTLHALRLLLEQFQQYDRRRCGKVEDRVAYELLAQSGVSAEIARSCVEACGPSFPYAGLMTDLLASKERYGYQYVLELFQRLDTDQSGYLTIDELRGLIGGGVFQLSGPEDVDRLLSWMDTNEDGGVSFEEFLHVALEFGQISSRSQSDADSGFWGGLGLHGWGFSGRNVAGTTFKPGRGNGGTAGFQSAQGATRNGASTGAAGMATVGPGSQQVVAPEQEPDLWRLRVGIFHAQGASVLDPKDFQSAYVVCSLCGEDPKSDSVELFRTHNVGYAGQATWDVEEELLGYQTPDGLEFSIICQGTGGSEQLLGTARLQHRQFFPLGCSTRLTLVQPRGGIQGTLWVKVLVMEDDGTVVSEAPLLEASNAGRANQRDPAPNGRETSGRAPPNRCSVTWGKSWVEERQPVVAAVNMYPPRPAMVPMAPALPCVPQHVYDRGPPFAAPFQQARPPLMAAPYRYR